MFCETSLFVGLVVPGDTIVLVTATAGRGLADWSTLVLAVVTGSLLGETVGFVIGRFFGPRLRASRLGRRIGERQVLRAERWLERRGRRRDPAEPVPAGDARPDPGDGRREQLPVPPLPGLDGAGVHRLGGRSTCRWGRRPASSYQALARDLHFAGWIVLGGVVVFLVAAWLVKRLLHRLERP